MNSPLFRLNENDFLRGLIVAAGVALLTVLQQSLQTHGVDFAAYDWNMIITAVVTSFIAYMGKNLAQDEDGLLFGRI